MMLRSRFRASLLSVALSIAATSTTSSAQDALPKLLAAVAASAQSPVPVVATGTAEIDGIEGKKSDRVAIALRSSQSKGEPAVFVEVEGAKTKILSTGGGPLQIAKGDKPKTASADTAIGSMTFTAEDFLPFSPERCAAMRIADLGAEQTTVICEPKQDRSQYKLMVWKFDRQRAVPLQVLLYKDTQSNLVKILRFDDYAAVEKSLHPKRIVAQDLKLRTRDVLTLEWHAAADAPQALFEPSSFAAASPLAATAKP